MTNYYEVVGSKGVLIQLDKYPSQETTTDFGVIVPKYEAYETEGGRPASKVVNEVYTTTGTIIQISAKARETLDEEKIDVQPGSRVYIYPAAKNPSNWFFPDRTKPVQDFDGLLLVQPNMIQAIVHNEDQD